MPYDIELLENIRDMLWDNTVGTWAGVVTAFVALVIALIALKKTR